MEDPRVYHMTAVGNRVGLKVLPGVEVGERAVWKWRGTTPRILPSYRQGGGGE